ncbi:MAG: thermonuclease family protein [Candidatus Magnetoovum sp. WYHC-5]|nr:thermonuclease family protein [Candidatus Magnetoovum sp. WYHC-5]
MKSKGNKGKNGKLRGLKFTLILIVALGLYFSISSADYNFLNKLNETGDYITAIKRFMKHKTNETSLPGKVIKVMDGDTVVIFSHFSTKPFKCRLYGIDSPEVGKNRVIGQKYANMAYEELKGMLLSYDVSVTLTGEKTYDRQVCILKKGNMDVNLEMIKRGYAWAYVHYLDEPYKSIYIGAQDKAKSEKLGIWSLSSPEAPWDFRKRLHDTTSKG